MRKNQDQFHLEKMAKVLRVSRSGYYKNISACPPRKAKESQKLLTMIQFIFGKHRGKYGCPRIYHELRKQGLTISKYRVEHIMKTHGIQAVKRRKKPKTTTPKRSGVDLVNRDFKADHPNQKWRSDISYLPLKTGFAYLAAILDMYSRKIVGFSVENHMQQELVMQALERALCRRNPKHGMICHTDRGSQYTAKQVEALLREHQIRSSKGLNAYDNAVMESFFSRLKAELLPNRHRFESINEAKQEIFKL